MSTAKQTLATLARFSQHGFGFLTIVHLELYVRLSVHKASAKKGSTRVDLLMCEKVMPVGRKKKRAQLRRVLAWWHDPHLTRHIREVILSCAGSLDEPQTLYFDSTDTLVLRERLTCLT